MAAAVKSADTTVLAKSGAWKFKATLGVVGIVSVVILAFMFRFEVGIIMLAAGSVGLLRGVVWVNQKRLGGAEELRRVRAENRMLELDVDLRAERLEQERQRTDELRLRKFFIETKVGVFRYRQISGDAEPVFVPGSATERKLLPSGQIIDAKPQLDLVEVMADAKNVYAIIGGQRVGKSTAAMHVSDYLTSRNLGQCIVVGSKMEPGEWVNCKQFIGEAGIRRALHGLLSTLDERHQKTIREPRLNIFLDDWINTVAIAGDLAETFFIRAATDMLAAGMVPYFLLQSDSNADWGNKHGAMLKNNFTKLVLSAHRVNGRIIPELTTAAVIWPGERSKNPVRLPGGLPQVGPDFQPQQVVFDADPQPTGTEAKILALHQQGQTPSAIARAVFGHDGGNQINEVRAIINRNQTPPLPPGEGWGEG